MTAKKTKATKPRSIIPDEILEMAKASKTRPAVLVMRLITDMLEQRYGKRAKMLFKLRIQLMKDLAKAVKSDRILGDLYKKGLSLDMKLYGMDDTPNALPEAVTAVVKAMDNSAPRSERGGMSRAITLRQLKTEATFMYAMMPIHKNASWTTTSREKLKELGMPSVNAGVYGLYSSSIKYEAEKRESLYQSADLEVKYFLPALYGKFAELVSQESKLIREMSSDMKLVAESAGRLSSIETLLKKMPAMLERDDLKEMLGFDINPQTDRIAVVAKAMSGEIFLNK